MDIRIAIQKTAVMTAFALCAGFAGSALVADGGALNVNTPIAAKVVKTSFLVM